MFNYSITVKTANKFGAGTDSDVFITLFGKDGVSEEMMLPEKRNIDEFERGDIDRYRLAVARDVGEFEQIRVRIRPKGFGHAWDLANIDVTTPQGNTVHFPFHVTISRRKGLAWFANTQGASKDSLIRLGLKFSAPIRISGGASFSGTKMTLNGRTYNNKGLTKGLGLKEGPLETAGGTYVLQLDQVFRYDRNENDIDDSFGEWEQQGRLRSNINTMIIANDNSLFVGSQTDGVLRFVPEARGWETFSNGLLDLSQTLARANVNVLSIDDSTGMLYAGASGRGVFRSSLSTDNWERVVIPSNNNILDNVTDLAFKANGDLYVIPKQKDSLWLFSKGEALVKQIAIDIEAPLESPLELLSLKVRGSDKLTIRTNQGFITEE